MKALCPQTYANQHYTFSYSGEVNLTSQFNLTDFLITHFFLVSSFKSFIEHQRLKPSLRQFPFWLTSLRLLYQIGIDAVLHN